MLELENATSLTGFWLNLDACHERRRFMNAQLDSLGTSCLYERVPGVQGDPLQAADHGLKPGEWGAWLGWMKLLELASQSTSSIVHLLEDDTEITGDFKGLFSWQPLWKILSDRRLICTDGYVTPQQAFQIVEYVSDVRSQDPWIVLEAGPKIPCLNSVLLTPVCASHLLAQLESMVRGGVDLLPVDVAIASLSIDWVTIAPFATGPILDLSVDSATRLDSESDLELSRFALTLLRRSLMVNGDFSDLRGGMFALMLKMIHQGILRPF